MWRLIPALLLLGACGSDRTPQTPEIRVLAESPSLRVTVEMLRPQMEEGAGALIGPFDLRFEVPKVVDALIDRLETRLYFDTNGNGAWDPTDRKAGLHGDDLRGRTSADFARGTSSYLESSFLATWVPEGATLLLDYAVEVGDAKQSDTARIY